MDSSTSALTGTSLDSGSGGRPGRHPRSTGEPFLGPPAGRPLPSLAPSFVLLVCVFALLVCAFALLVRVFKGKDAREAQSVQKRVERPGVVGAFGKEAGTKRASLGSSEGGRRRLCRLHAGGGTRTPDTRIMIPLL